MKNNRWFVVLWIAALVLVWTGCSCRKEMEPASKTPIPTISAALIIEQEGTLEDSPAPASATASSDAGMQNGQDYKPTPTQTNNQTPAATVSTTQTATPTDEPTSTPKPASGGGIEMPEDDLGS